MNLGSYAIDELLTFTVQTQVFATGVATDADAVPAYRIYEDETTAPLLTGTMALLDSANTAGLYSEQVTLSAANGFEKGKCYSIQIAATVSSVAGATIRVFQVGAAVDAKHLGGTSQTGRDVGASVLLASDAITAAVIASDAVTELQAGLSTLDAAGVRTAVGLASANLDTKLDDLPTNAELATALGTADDATLSQIALVKAQTDLIPASPAAVGSAMTLASGAITAAVIATDAIDSDAIAANAVTEIQSGLSTYAGGAVASVTGDVGGNVVGSVASVTADVGITQTGADKVWGSAARTLTSFGTLVADAAAAVWAAVTRTLTSAAPPTSAQVADAVWDEVIAGHATAGTTGAALGAAGAAGDPWATDLPDGYTGDQAGAIIGRFNAIAPTGPVTVVPGAPVDVTVCRVYGYFEDLANAPSSNITITFRLNEKAAVKSERLITERLITSRIIDGTLVDRFDKSLAYQDLQRNDNLTPAGTKYLVNCPDLGLVNEEMTLAADLFDLSTLVT